MNSPSIGSPLALDGVPGTNSTGSSGHGTGTGPGPGPGTGPGTNNNNSGAEELLKEQHKERERLLKENFNMKLRLDFLEDQLLRYKKNNAFEDEDSASDNVRLKLLLEEKQQELNQKNYSIVRATEAIGLLQREITEWQAKESQLCHQIQDKNQQHELLSTQLQTLQQQLQQVDFDHQLQQKNLQQSFQQELLLQRQQVEESQQHYWQQLVQQKDQELQVATQQLEKERQEAQQDKQKALERLQHDQQQQLQALNQEKQDMQANLNNISMKIGEFESEYRNLREQFDKQRRDNQLLQQENDGLRKQSQQLSSQAQRFQHDHGRVTSDVDKLAQERDKLVQTVETLRNENVALQSQLVFAQEKLGNSEQLQQKLELQKRQLEDECLEARRANKECEFEIHKLESQLQLADQRCNELASKVRTLEARGNHQVAHQERMQELEKDKYRAEEEMFRLKSEISLLKNDMELVAKNAKANELTAQEESTKAKEYREKMIAMERELMKKDALVDTLETRVSELASNRQNESARSLVQANEVEKIAEDRRNLRHALEKERLQAEARDRRLKELQQSEANLKNELHETEQELGRLFHVNMTPREMPMALVIRRAFQMLQNEFQEKATRLETQWNRNATMFQTQLEKLMERLNIGHEKLSHMDRLVNNSMNSHREARSTEQQLTEQLARVHDEFETERQMMQETLQMERMRKENAESALAQAQQDLSNVIASRNDSLTQSDAEYRRVKESNRLLVLELEERRKTLAQVRKQSSQVVEENMELLKVVRQLREHIAEQDHQLQSDQAKLLLQQHEQQQQHPKRGTDSSNHRASRKTQSQIRDVKDSILYQLDETQSIIRSACKRLESGGFLVTGQELAQISNQVVDHQMEEWLKRLELISNRARELVKETSRFQDKYADAWRLQVKLSGLQPHRGGESNYSDWVHRVGEECHKLLNENRDLMESICRISKSLQKFVTSRRVASEQLEALGPPANNNNNNNHNKKKTRNEFSYGPEQDGNQFDKRGSDIHHYFSSPLKKSWSRDPGHGESSLSNRRAQDDDQEGGDVGRSIGGGIYKGSLSSLDRIGENLQEIERKIRSYRD